MNWCNGCNKEIKNSEIYEIIEVQGIRKIFCNKHYNKEVLKC